MIKWLRKTKFDQNQIKIIRKRSFSGLIHCGSTKDFMKDKIQTIIIHKLDKDFRGKWKNVDGANSKVK